MSNLSARRIAQLNYKPHQDSIFAECAKATRNQLSHPRAALPGLQYFQVVPFGLDSNAAQPHVPGNLYLKEVLPDNFHPGR